MKKLALLLISAILFANEVETLNLLDDLRDASELTTKTKLNSNKTPAIVSVLHGDELKKLGITNLYTALETVPGIEISMGTAGAKQINMRGNKSLVRDKIKLMIDGISTHSELSGASYFYLDMPIELIERIEVIRGPASALYGSFAHIGVINVITKSSAHKNNIVFATASSEGFKGTGFVQHINSDMLKIAIDGFFQDNKNSREYGSYSLLPAQNEFTSYEDFTNKSLGVNIEIAKELSLSTRWLTLDNQNYFGYGNWPIVQDPKRLKHTSFISELKYTPKLSSDASMEIKAGYKFYKFEGTARVHPYSVQQPKPPYPPYDLLGRGNYKEEVFYSDIALKYHLDAHNILLGTYVSHAREGDTTYHTNNPVASEVTDVPLDGNGIKPNISRTQYAFYFNDIFTINNKFSADIGIRYDHYNDAQESFAPKLALLYNPDDMQSYKLMYQRSFRAPAWIELYGTTQPFFGDKNLKSETIDTLEFAYQYQSMLDSWFKINFFYTKMKNFINRDANYNLYNDKESKSYGMEVELKLPLYDTASLNSNYSYTNLSDNDGNDLPFVANHLANIMFIQEINREWSAGSKLRYVGKRRREVSDSRGDLSDYVTFDQTLTFTRKAFSLQASVKNLFDKDVVFPSPLGSGSTTGTYEEDFSRDGRVFWVSIGWTFE